MATVKATGMMQGSTLDLYILLMGWSVYLFVQPHLSAWVMSLCSMTMHNIKPPDENIRDKIFAAFFLKIQRTVPDVIRTAESIRKKPVTAISLP